MNSQSTADLLKMHVDSDMDIRDILVKIMADHPEISAPIAAIKALLEIIRHSKATTMSEFMETLNLSSQVLKDSTEHPISVSAGCDLFMRFVTLTSSHESTSEFQTCKEYLLKSGNFVVEKALTQKRRIVQHGQDFIRDDAVILIHSYSRVVMQLLESAAIRHKKRFQLYVTESRPSNSGLKAAKHLESLGIPVVVIPDSAVGYIIDKVDMVLVGAEGVVENGGLINAIGTYQIAMVAHIARIPFYAAAESFKFVRMFPLNQYDLPTQKPSSLKLSPATAGGFEATDSKLVHSHASVDYTPPQYITLLFTDLGVLTPSGVSDELIKL